MVMSTANALLVTLPIGWYLATRTDLGPTGLFQATLVGAIVVTTALGGYVALMLRVQRLAEFPRPGRFLTGAGAPQAIATPSLHGSSP